MASLQEFASGRTSSSTPSSGLSLFTQSRSPSEWKPISIPKQKTAKKTTTVTSTPQAPTIGTLQKTSSNIIKKISDQVKFIFSAPKIHSPVPESALKQTQTEPLKIQGGQNRLTPSQLKGVVPQARTSSAKIPSPVESVLTSIQKYLPTTVKTVKEISTLIADPEFKKSDPKKAIPAAWEAIKTPFIDFMKRSIRAEEPGISFKEKSLRKVEKTVGAVNVLFSPISALFEAGNNIPIVGTLTRMISLPFVTLGEGAPQVSNKIIDSLPIEKKTKERVKPVIAEIFTLSTQLAFGKLSEVASRKATNTIKQVGIENFEKLTKDTIEIAGVKKTVKLTPSDVRDINLGKAAYEADLVKSLGLSSVEWRRAVKEGLTIEVPSEKIVRIIDKPYWEKVKSMFKIEPTNREIRTTAKPQTTSGFAGYLTDGEYTPQGIIGTILKAGQENTLEGKLAIKSAIEAQKAGQNIIIQKEQGNIVQEADSSLLESDEVKKIETKDTQRTKEIRQKITKIEEDIQLRRQENEMKKSILDAFEPKQIQVMRSLKRAVNSRINKGMDTMSIEDLPSYKDNIRDIMSAIGTNSEAEAVRYIIEDLPDPIITANTKEELRKIEVFKSHLTPKEIEVPRSQLPVGEGKPKASKLEARAKGLQDIIKNATPEQLQDLGLSMSNTAKNNQQLKDASEYVTNNLDEALEVLEGKKDAPKGILLNSILVAMANEAKGNVSLAIKVSGLFSKRFGQEIQILSQLDPNSPVVAMKEVVKFREQVFKKRYGGRSIDKVRREQVAKIKKNVKVASKYDWNAFINSIDTC